MICGESGSSEYPFDKLRAGLRTGVWGGLDGLAIPLAARSVRERWGCFCRRGREIHAIIDFRQREVDADGWNRQYAVQAFGLSKQP